MNQTICQTFESSRHRSREQIAIRRRHNAHWLELNWSDLYELTRTVGGALKAAGVQAGDRVALVSETRLEWLVSDFAIMGVGAVTVPVYPNQQAEEMRFILQHSAATFLLIDNVDQWMKWKQIHESCPEIKTVMVFDGHEEIPDNVWDWDKMLEEGTEYINAHPDFFEKSIASQTIHDLATIVYTSGTTGEPRGVRITHRQIQSEVQGILSLLPLTSKDSSLAFLPFAHVLGRIEGWCSIAAGFTLSFAESIDQMRSNLQEVRPTFLVAVPRIFEKFYAAIQSQLQASPAKAKLFEWAMEVGRQVSRQLQKGKTISPTLLAQKAVADRLVFRPIQKKLGGRLRFAFSGGAPLGKELIEFFHAIGILIIEGYGLTETTAAITANSPLNYRFGSVGRALPGVEIELASDGEILVRGGQVSPDYYDPADKNPQKSEREDFFATGDIGVFDQDGFLYITDRKKDLIKTSGGKYVAPQKLENLLKLNPLISQALIHGDQEKYIVAVITLNPEKVLEYAKENGISYQDYGMLCQHPQVRALIRTAVAEVNNGLASFETIKNFAILPREFSIEAGELTPSLKIKRKYCSTKYQDLIRELYN